MAGKPWYNNGKIEIQRNNDQIIPQGFVKGRLKFSETTIQKFKQAQLNKSSEQKKLENEKRSNSLKLFHSKQSIQHKNKRNEKYKQTMKNKSQEWKNQYKKKLSKSSKGKNKGRTPWNKGLTKEVDQRVLKNSKSTAQSIKKLSDKLKQQNPNYFNDWRKHINDVMKQNNSFSTSKPQEQFYLKLCQKYGQQNVIRQYSDERYPFNCDFYIKSQDLFIQLNLHWTHGGHLFDEKNCDDLKKLQFLKEKSKKSNFYKNAIYVWTQLDVKKHKIALENNLNYKAIYDKQVSLTQ